MAVKYMSNAESLTKVFSEQITVEKMSGWAAAGLIMVMKGDTPSEFRQAYPFPAYVQMHKLSNESVLNKGPAREKWGRGEFRGWHHFETFTYYMPKRSIKKGKPEVHAGMYGKGIREAGGSTNYLGSLNYMKTRIKQPGYIRDAWKESRGNNLTKETLNYMIVHGIEKMASQTEGAVK